MAKTRTVTRSDSEDFALSIRKLHKLVDDALNNKRVTVPLYLPTALPADAVDGQIALASDGSTGAYGYNSTAGWFPLGDGIKLDEIINPSGNHYLDIELGAASYIELSAPWVNIGSTDDAIIPNMSVTGDWIAITAGRTIVIAAPNLLDVTGAGEHWAISGTGALFQSTNGMAFQMEADFGIFLNAPANFFVQLDVAGIAYIRDHVAGTIFEIHEDGSIHGRASVGAITWDL